jgi:heterotetrameric sarcosine oxidase gamma subunit
VTDAPVATARCAPDALLRLEIWGDLAAVAARAAATGFALPAGLRSGDTPLGRLIWVEPGVFLLRAPLGELSAAAARLEAVAWGDGAVIDITGGLARFTLAGPGWRELLTVGGVFDVENPAFTIGCTAATVLHHAAIWIDVIGEAEADVYSLPSYAQELAEAWARAVARMAA